MEKYCSRRSVSIVALLLLATVQMAAKVVDVAEASKLAAAFLSPKQKTNSQPVRMRQVKPSAGGRLAAPAVGDPAFYVFTPEEGKGFVIVSADDAATPVLGYSDTHIIDMGNLPPALETLMSQWTEQINHARSQGLEPTAETKAKWAQASPSQTKVLLETAQWNQDSPYNNECPMLDGGRCLTGCVATLYAIIMRYYSYALQVSTVTTPYTSGQGVYVPSRQIDGQYEWDKMPLNYPGGGYGDDRDDAVARLIADIGVFMESNYGLHATAANIRQTQILDLFGYKYENIIYRDQFTSNFWNAKLKDCLDLGHPISYSGGSHAFILDGYTEDGLYHVNWGWGGFENGFFSLDALQAGGNEFDYGQTAMLGICPIDDTGHTAPDYVAKAGEFYFTELQNAFIYANYTGEEVQLIKDIDDSEMYISVTGNVSFNLCGHKLSLDSFLTSGTLNIIDTQGGVLNFNLGYVYWDGTVNVYSGRYKSSKGIYGAGCINYYGGLFNYDISNNVADGYIACKNTDPVTCNEYPYTVIKVNNIPEGTNVASVNGQMFNTLSTALHYAQTLTETANVKLLEDVMISNINIQKGNIVLDTNGHNIKAGSIINYTDLTICNTKDVGKIELITALNNNYPLYNYVTLKLDNVTIEGDKEDIYSFFYNDGTVDLRGCKIRATTNSTVIYNRGQCDIYESEITSLNDKRLIYSGGAANIYSGKFSAPYGCYAFDEGSINVYGGLFSFDITNYVAEGYITIDNTNLATCEEYPYTVIKKGDVPEGTIVASVNGQQFNTFPPAIRYAQTLTEVANIKLLEEVTIDNIEIWNGNIVIDINGHNLNTIRIYSRTNLTICNAGKAGKIEIIPNEDFPLYNNGGTLKLENITIEGGHEDSYCFLYNNGTAEIRGCTMRGKVDQGVIYNGGQCDIYESEVTCLNDKWLIFCGGIANIYSGKFSAPYGIYVYEKRSVNIYGGLFSFDPSKYLAMGMVVSANTDPETAAAYPYLVHPASDAVGTIAADGSDPVVHYTMDGRKVDSPRLGSVVITKHSDGSVTKRVWR